jgi:hypothetical protein
VKTTEEKYFYATSGPTVQTALLTSKWRTQMLSPTATGTQQKWLQHKSERSSGNTLRPALSNAITSPLLFAPPMVCLVMRHLPLPNNLRQSWLPNGKNRTHKFVDTFRLSTLWLPVPLSHFAPFLRNLNSILWKTPCSNPTQWQQKAGPTLTQHHFQQSSALSLAR